MVGMHVHSLAHAASGYHKVLEDNRKLYNQVQDLKGNLDHLSYIIEFSVNFLLKIILFWCL